MPRSRSVVLVGYRKDIESATNNVKYIGFRSRETAEEERGFFNRTIEHGADYEMFLNKICEHPALQHDHTVKMHTMVLSMYENDYRSLLESGSNLKELTREVMSDLEERKGIKLEWIAAVHEKAGHPHVHIGIMSVGIDEAGQNRRLFLDKENDLPWLRESFLEKIERRIPDLEQTHERAHHRTHGRSKSRHGSREASHALQSLSQNYQDRMKSMAKDKRNRKRRSRRATSRIEQQRQAPQQPHER